MDYYMGFKLVQAQPCFRHQEEHGPMIGTENSYLLNSDIKEGSCIDTEHWKEGYMVTYPDGYVSWSPKETFDKANLRVDKNPKLPSAISISSAMVENFILKTEASTLGDKTTLVVCTLVNGFELVESSSCVDVENYNEEMGAEICMDKIKDKIWFLLGFLLQTASKGVSNVNMGHLETSSGQIRKLFQQAMKQQQKFIGVLIQVKVLQVPELIVNSNVNFQLSKHTIRKLIMRTYN